MTILFNPFFCNRSFFFFPPSFLTACYKMTLSDLDETVSSLEYSRRVGISLNEDKLT